MAEEQVKEEKEQEQKKSDKQVVSFAKYKRETDEFKAELSALKEEIAKRDTQISELTKAAESQDAEGLREQLKEAEEANQKFKAESEKRENNLKRDYLLDTELIKMGVRNSKAARALLNLDEIKVTEDGKLEGADLAKLKEDNPYLFEKPQAKDAGGAQSGSTSADEFAAMRRSAGLE